MRKQPKVVMRPLGRERAMGQYHADEPTIEIDPRLSAKDELTVYIHEMFHHLWPEMTEEEVDGKSIELGKFLWKHGFRQVKNK